jgi:hypothetical protein
MAFFNVYCSLGTGNEIWRWELVEMLLGLYHSLVHWFVMDTEEVHTVALGIESLMPQPSGWAFLGGRAGRDLSTS